MITRHEKQERASESLERLQKRDDDGEAEN